MSQGLQTRIRLSNSGANRRVKFEHEYATRSVKEDSVMVGPVGKWLLAAFLIVVAVLYALRWLPAA